MHLVTHQKAESLYADGSRKSFRNGTGQGEAPIYRESEFGVSSPLYGRGVIYQGELQDTYSGNFNDDFKYLPDDSIPIRKVPVFLFWAHLWLLS